MITQCEICGTLQQQYNTYDPSSNYQNTVERQLNEQARRLRRQLKVVIVLSAVLGAACVYMIVTTVGWVTGEFMTGKCRNAIEKMKENAA